MKVGVIFVAGGKSQRMKGIEKLLLYIGGEYVVMRGLNLFEKSPLVDRIVFSTNPEIKAIVEPVTKYFMTDVCFDVSQEGRPKAVYDALKLFPTPPDLILVHDGARPFASMELVNRVIQNITEFDGVVPGLPPQNHILQIDENGYATDLLSQADLAFVQTPQGFPYDVINHAYQKAFEQGILDTFTDSASVVEWAGGKVKVILGEATNFKLTTPADIEKAEKLFG